jgi:alanine racemase
VNPSNPPSSARIWADIDLNAVRSNARTVADAAGVRLLPMVKASAYGVGAIPVARTLEPMDPWGYGVATIGEGVELRMAGITRPVIVFSPLQPETAVLYREHRLRPAIGDLASMDEWLARSGDPFHLEIDTGMARAGFSWCDRDDIVELRSRLADADGWEGVFTHFHSADDDPGTMARQWSRFQDVLATLPRRPALVHAANSGAALRERRYIADMVRPGIFLYGGEAGGRYPTTVVALRTRVMAVRRVAAGESVSYGASWVAPKDTLVATLGCGYADGIPRSLGNKGSVELNGRILPIVGRVTMDMTMVAVEPEAPVRPGDVATIFGGRIAIDQQAANAGTIAYELLTGMSGRVERRYHNP